MTERFAALDEFARWIETHRDALTARGLIVASATSPDDGRPKRSTWLDLVGARRLGRLILWDTGEAELELADVSTGDVETRHRRMDTHADLEQALTRQVDWVCTAE